MPLISIVVPVYKVEQYLDRCVESLINQTEKDIEIILVDDGSPDNCPALCDEWAKKDNRIKVVHKQNGGLGLARNSGIEAASGKYIGFIDSDDYVKTDMYETLKNAMEKHDAALAITGFCCVGGIMSAKEDAVDYINCFEEETVFSGKEGLDDLLLNISGAPPTASQDSKYGFSSVKNLFLLSVINENGIRFENERKVMSEDVFFMLRYINCIEKAVGVKGAHYFYCRNGESLSKSYRGDRFEKCKFLIEEINRDLSKRMPETVYKIYTDRLFQAYARAACMQEIQFKEQNKLSNKELKARLSAICKSNELQNVLKKYPWHKLPITQAFFAFTMRFGLYGLMILSVRIKDRG